MLSHIQLIVGLGNPGAQYGQTRHNAGFWFAEAVARRHGGSFKSDSKFHGEACKVQIDGRELWLLKPMTFMNRSGQAVAALARFYKIAPENILVAHDELDLPPGEVRLKRGGGHGGHNGLRDIAAKLSSRDFIRVRLGVGRPEHGDVSNYVLGKFTADEQPLVDEMVESACDAVETLLRDGVEAAQNQFNSR